MRLTISLLLLGGVFCAGGFVGDRLAGLTPAPPDPRVMHLEGEVLDLRVRLDILRRAEVRRPVVPIAVIGDDHIPPTNLPTGGGDD